MPSCGPTKPTHGSIGFFLTRVEGSVRVGTNRTGDPALDLHDPITTSVQPVGAGRKYDFTTGNGKTVSFVITETGGELELEMSGDLEKLRLDVAKDGRDSVYIENGVALRLIPSDIEEP